MAKQIPAPRRLVRRLDIAIAEDFQTIVVQTGGWSPREDTVRRELKGEEELPFSD